MSLNAVFGKGINPIALNVNFGHVGSFPADLFPLIFQNLKADLSSAALVCKNWKVMADDNGFRQMIRPAQTFGRQEWQKYIGVDAGEEPCLPRRAYWDLEKEGGFLTFIPEKVIMTKEDGKEEEVILDNLETIGNLIKKPKTDLETGYSQNSCQEAIKEKRQPEKPHWVWIKKEIMGIDKTYDQQHTVAKEENKKISGAKINGLTDTVITFFMEYVRSKERNFRYVWICVNEKIDGRGIWIGFCCPGLVVYKGTANPTGNDVGFVCARKSFGHFAKNFIVDTKKEAL